MTDPLTPPGCDLRDFPFLPIDVQRLLTSETWVLGTADEKAAAITLWLACWHQVPAASVPNNDRMLAHLSQAGSKWPKVKEHALRGWVDGGDGRLYHPVVAEKALAAWIEKLNSAISGAVGNAKRWQTEVDTSAQEAALCDAICRLKRIAPASPCLKKKVVMSRNKSSPPDRPPTQNSSPPDRKREGEREGEGYVEIQERTHTPLVHDAPVCVGNPVQESSVSTPVTPPAAPPPPVTPTAAGAACLAMRAEGIVDVNPSSPKLAALLEAGATNEELAAAAKGAVDRQKGFAYALGTVQKQREEAAAMASGLHAGPMPTRSHAGHKTARQSLVEGGAAAMFEGATHV